MLVPSSRAAAPLAAPLPPAAAQVRLARRRTRRFAVALVLFALGYAEAYAAVVRYEVGLNRWQQEIRALEENNELRAKLAGKQSAAALDAQAAGRLGMAPPVGIEYVALPPAAARPAPAPPAALPAAAAPRPGY